MTSESDSYAPGSQQDQDNKKKGRKKFIQVGIPTDVYTGSPTYPTALSDGIPDNILMVDDDTPFDIGNGEYLDL